MQCDVTAATCTFVLPLKQVSQLHQLNRSMSFILFERKGVRNISTPGVVGHVLERALIFLRLRLSLRERFFFHFSLILQDT